MKGHIHTDRFLDPALSHHVQGKKRIRQVFLADLKAYSKLLYITDAACLAKMAERGQIVGAKVDEPLAFDNAISAIFMPQKGATS